jgi:selenophosphate synthase
VPLNWDRKLDEQGKFPQGMIRIKGELVRGVGEIGDFLIDQYEVTNRQFKEFVDKGGYQEKKHWKERFLKDLTRGANACAVRFGTTIVGGDTKETTEITLCGTVVGTVKKNEFMPRKGARPGDIVAVTGRLGSAVCQD